MRPSHAAFRFTHRRLEGRHVRLGYLLHGGPSPDAVLEETFTLPAEPEPTEALDRAIEALHFAAGVSYWKTSCPPVIETEGEGLPESDARFFERLWSHGLGELFVRNGLSPRTPVRFPRGRAGRPPAPVARLEDARPLVLIGGGKDSAVSIELLLEAGERPILLCVGRHARIMQAAAVTGLPLRVVERTLAPGLRELNAAGALNGHVPVTAIVQLAAQLVAIGEGLSAVVASNERSASYGNAIVDGVEVNHQWSKGLDCERLLQAWSARHLVVGPALFSLLRPFSELAIARELARFPRWLPAITSCNANFSLSAREVPRWCGTCPKCVFVFAVTAPWLDEGQRRTLFERDFLDDERTVPVLAELLGLEGHKPFECVGTPEETQAALWACHERGLFPEAPGMRLFRDRVLPALSDPEALLRRALEPSSEHLVPVRFLPAIHAAGPAR